MKKLLASFVLAIGVTSIFVPNVTMAASNNHNFHFRLAADDAAKKCRDKGGVPTSGVLGDKCVGGTGADGKYQNPIFSMTSLLITIAISFMGLAMMGLLVFAGIRYITSAGNPDDVKAAKSLITQVITALVLFAIMGAVLTLILPLNYDTGIPDLFK